MFKIKLNGNALRNMSDKTVMAAILGFICFWFFVVALRLALLVGLCYVAWHFIAKFW